MPEKCKRLLFVCSQNRLRSPTAARVFSQWPGVEAKSAGLDKDARIPLSPELIGWADIILVMEQAHRKKLRKRFRAHLAGKPVIVLDVPDEYVFMQEELVQLLKNRVPWLASL